MKRWIILIGSLAIVAVVAYIAYTSFASARAAQQSLSADELATVRRGDLIATVSATGAIKPSVSTDLSFAASGTIADVFVSRGDKVKAGQPLAKLDTTELDLQLKQAEASVSIAQSKLNQLQKGGSDTAVSAANANLASAQAAYDKLLHPDRTAVAMAKADLDKAKAALDQAQAGYDRIGGATNPNIGMLPESLRLQQATLDYQKAENAYNQQFTPSNAQLKAAQAQIQAARDQLARLSPTSDDVAQAQANLNSALASRDLAKQRIDDSTLLAPSDGTIVSESLDKGSFAQPGKPVATLADLDHLQITLNIDETDIPRIAIGQKVALDLDAFPDEAISGKVVEIAPSAATVQGVVNYEVRIEVAAGSVPIKAGMTANANVEVARKDNVLVVPNRAVRASGNKRLVTVYDGLSQKEVEVQLGLSNDQESEVLAGLVEGQQVVTSAVSKGIPGFGPGGQGGGQ
ncbi:MAG: efflux RND transporter periplasmic adaptor subunit [Rudaea sp.]